jgi:hypothetical protein
MLKNAALSSMNAVPFMHPCVVVHTLRNYSDRSDVKFTYDRNIQATEKNYKSVAVKRPDPSISFINISLP